MDSTFLFIILLGVVGAVVLVAWLRSRTITNDVHPQPSDWVQDIQKGDVRLPQSAAADMQRLLDQGKKIEAIKVVRQHTGLDLKEAKDYIEAVASRKQPIVSPGVQRDESGIPPELDKKNLEQQVRQLLAAGKKIEAVKLVRKNTGWGLKDSKDFVDQLE